MEGTGSAAGTWARLPPLLLMDARGGGINPIDGLPYTGPTGHTYLLDAVPQVVEPHVLDLHSEAFRHKQRVEGELVTGLGSVASR